MYTTDSNIPSEINTEEHEPQLTSLDPNERKLARKLRIERRWESIRRQGTSIKSFEEEDYKGEIQAQVQMSAEILEKYIQESEEYITNVRVANDAREVDRRDAEGVGREKVIEQLENEAQVAQNMFEEIAEKWTTIENYKDPLLINEEIQSQKEKCDMLIKQKDGIIAMLKDEIKKAERHFTRDQEKQMEDINILSQRIQKQVSFMRDAYQKELELIEEVILKERKRLIDQKDKKWEELYKKREQQEITNSDKKFEQLGKFEDKMTSLRVQFEEKYRQTYIRLENDIDTLQRELERIKALALLNSEKLDYNYQILKKREDENIIIKSQQKRRINKLQDVINDLRKKTQEYESKTNNLLKKLSEDTKKLHKNILLVEEKADHFAIVNNEKFHKVWNLNKDSCQYVLKKIIETDKLLYEQQMGIQWSAPSYHILKMKHLQSYKDAIMCTDESSTTRSITSVSSVAIGPSRDKRLEGEFPQKMYAPGSTKTNDLDSNKIYRRLLKYILTHVSDKSGFLTEKRLKELLSPYAEDQKTLVRLDNVFASLGIHKKEDIDLLIIYFIPYVHCPVCSTQPEAGLPSSTLTRYTSQISNLPGFIRKETENVDCVELEKAYYAVQQPVHVLEESVKVLVDTSNNSEEVEFESEESLDHICGGVHEGGGEQSSSAPKEKKAAFNKRPFEDNKFYCEFNHQLVISPVYILRALREFVMVYYEEKEGLPTTAERLQKKRHTISRLLSEPDIVKYWDRFTKIYDEDRIRVWDALFEGLRKYHEILKDRKMLCEQVVDLRRQNRDLKRLLANYIDHTELMPSPCESENQRHLHSVTPSYANTK